MPQPKRNPYGGNEAARQCLATPHWFIGALIDRGFCFDLDVCATPETAVCSRYYTEADDGLSCDWRTVTGGWAWCNPPFSECRKWIAKAKQEAYHNITSTLMLLPLTPGVDWFQRHHRVAIRKHIVIPRLNFWDPVLGKLTNRANNNVCLWEIVPYQSCGFPDLSMDYWEIRKPKGATR